MGLFTVSPADKANFLRQLNAALATMEKEVDEVYRGFVTATFHAVARETPQWSGNAASNWNVSLNGPDLSWITTLKEAAAPDRSARAGMLRKWDTPYGPAGAKGDERAIMLAVRRAAPTLLTITKLSTVHLSNASANLDNESYIQYLEENPDGFLRPVNQPGHMAERVANSAASFGRLTEAQQTALRVLKPGQINNGGFGL